MEGAVSFAAGLLAPAGSALGGWPAPVGGASGTIAGGLGIGAVGVIIPPELARAEGEPATQREERPASRLTAREEGASAGRMGLERMRGSEAVERWRATALWADQFTSLASICSK